MEIKRKKANIFKAFFGTIITTTAIFVVLYFALIYSMYRNPAKYGILDHKRGITRTMFFGALIGVYLLALIIGTYLKVRGAIWNNRHMDLPVVAVEEGFLRIHDYENKDKKIPLDEIKKISTDDKQTKLRIEYGKEFFYISFVEDAAAAVEELCALLPTCTKTGQVAPPDENEKGGDKCD